MKINRQVIEALKPCKDRFDNYVMHYGDKEFTPAKFMGLKNITHQDKIWVALRLIDKKKLPLLAADIAESVLHIFESRYPNDNRPRKAIESARSGDKKKANAAAYDARAAYYAADAAYNTAYAAANAAYYAAANAANDAVHAAPDKAKQEKLIRTLCIKYMK